MITPERWSTFRRDGYVSLGVVIDADEVAALAQRVDDLALGAVVNPAIQFQLDTGGAYDDLPSAVGQLAEPTLAYRKVQGLEFDPLFRRVMELPIVREVCGELYGAHADISVFRAMVMNKPAGQGTVLPWHQDGGDTWQLDRDPLITLWMALDPATTENGCMEVVPGSHRLGLLTRWGSTVSEEHAVLHCPAELVRPIEVAPGELILLHNWVIHRSGVNPSGIPRRAFTTCLMDARTVAVQTGDRYPLLFGEATAGAYPFVSELRAERDFWRHSQATAEEYAHSLEAEVAKLRAALGARDL